MKVYLQDKLEWNFSNDYPTIYNGRYWERVDPTPCYPHKIEIVEAHIPLVEKAFRINPDYAPDYHLLAYETPARVNGWTDRTWQYNGDSEPRSWKARITFNGKRTPPHPAMTRYLVAHEYGHVLHYWLQDKWGVKDTGDQTDEVYQEYSKIRGLELNGNYGPGKWSSNIGEIFANDFRILLTGIETEFWPHEVERPENVKNIYGWWLEQREKYAYADNEVTDESRVSEQPD